MCLESLGVSPIRAVFLCQGARQINLSLMDDLVQLYSPFRFRDLLPSLEIFSAAKLSSLHLIP